MKKTPIIPVKLIEEEHDSIISRRYGRKSMRDKIKRAELPGRFLNYNDFRYLDEHGEIVRHKKGVILYSYTSGIDFSPSYYLVEYSKNYFITDITSLEKGYEKALSVYNRIKSEW